MGLIVDKVKHASSIDEKLIIIGEAIEEILNRLDKMEKKVGFERGRISGGVKPFELPKTYQDIPPGKHPDLIGVSKD